MVREILHPRTWFFLDSVAQVTAKLEQAVAIQRFRPSPTEPVKEGEETAA